MPWTDTLLLPTALGASLPAWHLFTRLGEAQLLLPAAAVVAVSMWRQPGMQAVTLRWALLLLGAALLTTVSKLAFIGWGIGSAALDFTGVSGHTMFASAIYPVLLAALVPVAWPAAWPARRAVSGPGGRRWAAVLGAVLALAVGVSRVVVGAHSVSEVVAGWLVGGVAGAVAWQLVMRGSRSASASASGSRSISRSAAQSDPEVPARASPWPLLFTALWFGAAALLAPPAQTHSMVTRWALALSGHAQPYTRARLHGRALQSAGAAPVAVAVPLLALPSAAVPSIAVIGPLPLKRSSAR